jgi:hypothetical protein
MHGAVKTASRLYESFVHATGRNTFLRLTQLHTPAIATKTIPRSHSRYTSRAVVTRQCTMSAWPLSTRSAPKRQRQMGRAPPRPCPGSDLTLFSYYMYRCVIKRLRYVCMAHVRTFLRDEGGPIPSHHFLKGLSAILTV